MVSEVGGKGIKQYSHYVVSHLKFNRFVFFPISDTGNYTTCNININNQTLLSNTKPVVNNNSVTTSYCLCCDQASYRILALDVNNMNRCCLSKIYSLRLSTISNQF